MKGMALIAVAESHLSGQYRGVLVRGC